MVTYEELIKISQIDSKQYGFLDKQWHIECDAIPIVFPYKTKVKNELGVPGEVIDIDDDNSHGPGGGAVKYLVIKFETGIIKKVPYYKLFLLNR